MTTTLVGELEKMIAVSDNIQNVLQSDAVYTVLLFSSKYGKTLPPAASYLAKCQHVCQRKPQRPKAARVALSVCVYLAFVLR
jgi:hypothetical protein